MKEALSNIESEGRQNDVIVDLSEKSIRANEIFWDSVFVYCIGHGFEFILRNDRQLYSYLRKIGTVRS